MPSSIFEGVAIRRDGADELGVDGAVDHDMADMNALWGQLARHALREGAQRVFCSGERRKTVAAAQARRRAGEEDRAPAARHHDARRLASHEEAARKPPSPRP